MKQIDVMNFIKERNTKANKIILAFILVAILFLLIF